MMAIKRMFNYIPTLRYSSDSYLKSGDRLKQTRIFSSQDLVEFSKLSFDANPLHLDPEFARNAGFKDRVVPGMLPGAVYASQTLHFRSPVYVEEEITGEVEATSIRESKKKYIAKFTTRCFNNTGVLVLDGEAMAVLPTLCPTKA
ncbi:MaoC-like domain-containing protein [Cynara cardunculus var. scolymus]|uniref:MaoC-like domain-containing protein n=1 Tax=Cynara cardunculus var. scolymus TaxID=59895 RepID=A0A103Y084_CYNCS|nr:MaoC-like domain-containing protein [Cynara cardunculus var. scolymus]